MDINKWSADKCGVTFKDGQFTKAYYWCINDEIQGSDWSIYKPDCMEIIREKFKIDTEYNHDDELWISNAGYGIGRGKTIKEAELACLTAIYEIKRLLKKLF